MNDIFNNIKRGDILYCDIGQGVGSEQSGIRPCVVIQNDLGNKFSPTIIIAAITSKINKTVLPTHIRINEDGNIIGLSSESIILCEQIRTLSKERIKGYIGRLRVEDLKKLNKSLDISIGSANSQEKKIKDVSTELKIKERIILESLKRASVECINYLLEDYKKTLILLKRVCSRENLQMYSYYIPNEQIKNLLFNDNIRKNVV